MTDATAAPAPVRVWDLPTRLFHWVLTLAVIGLVVTAKIGGNAMAWHFRLGYVVFALLLFRLLWGFVGGRWSRFASFVYGPGSLVRYLKGSARADDVFEIGHSPTGALSVFALLAFLALQVGTGLISFDDIEQVGGPLNRFVSETTAGKALGYHKSIGQWVILTLVGLHIAAVLFYLWGKRRNLIAPMWHGDKPLADAALAATDTATSRVVALMLLGACAGFVAWIVALGT